VKLERIQELEVHNGSSTSSESPWRCHLPTEDSEASTADPLRSVMAGERIVTPPSTVCKDIEGPPPIGAAMPVDPNPVAHKVRISKRTLKPIRKYVKKVKSNTSVPSVSVDMNNPK
jgi:hypothetical protein